MLRALAGPFPDVTFCPTGGITLETAPDYLALRQCRLRRRLMAGAEGRRRRRRLAEDHRAGRPGRDTAQGPLTGGGSDGSAGAYGPAVVGSIIQWISVIRLAGKPLTRRGGG